MQKPRSMPWETVLSNEIISYSAGQQAKAYTATGRKVVEHDGVFFNEVSPGYKVYWPIDVLHPHARAIKAIPATRGHKMVVADPAKANGFLNIMVARDVADFDIGLLSKKRRSDVRRSLKRIEVRFMDEPEGLIAQGASDVDASSENGPVMEACDPNPSLKNGSAAPCVIRASDGTARSSRAGSPGSPA